MPVMMMITSLASMTVATPTVRAERGTYTPIKHIGRGHEHDNNALRGDDNVAGGGGGGQRCVLAWSKWRYNTVTALAGASGQQDAT